MNTATNVQKRTYTFQEYLKLEEREQIRYEYYKGEVFAMAGASLNHGDIVYNINAGIKSVFTKRGCRSFQESYKLELLDSNYYVYPDVILTCDQEDLQATYIIKHPVFIAEVFSPSTESYDRKIKYKRYARLESLKYLLFVAQERPFVELFSRTNSSTLFNFQCFDQLSDVIDFPELDFQLQLQDIYEGIKFLANENLDLYNQM